MKDTSFYSNFSFNSRGKLHSFDEPIVMGILNATPDSFYAESRVSKTDVLSGKIIEMIADGATIIDVGGYSSRPGAAEVSVQEEVDRVCEVIQTIRAIDSSVLISLDTFRSEVVQEAFKSGADIVNDISAGKLDSAMHEVVAELRMPYIMMHMKGTPQNMQSHCDYEHLVMDVNLYFSEQIVKARAAGIKDIIIDPGFGFSKTREQNFELLKQLSLLTLHECPLLVGVSRKSMIYKTLDCSPEEALNGTSVLNGFALSQGAQILRVHDVKEAVEVIALHQAIHCAE